MIDKTEGTRQWAVQNTPSLLYTLYSIIYNLYSTAEASLKVHAY
jgi:hypothetical protein